MVNAEVLETDVLEVITQCLAVAKNNPRLRAGQQINPLQKSVRSFADAFGGMTNEERDEMAKTFYSKYYLEAITDDGQTDWLDNLDQPSVELALGEGDVKIHAWPRIPSRSRLLCSTSGGPGAACLRTAPSCRIKSWRTSMPLSNRFRRLLMPKSIPLLANP